MVATRKGGSDGLGGVLNKAAGGVVMAYFSNGTEGMVFDCDGCPYADEPCPIAWVQMDSNYEACNVPVARKILDQLVKQDGTCTMHEMIKEMAK